MSHVSWSFVLVQWVKVRNDRSFCWYWWNCWPSLFILSFHSEILNNTISVHSIRVVFVVVFIGHLQLPVQSVPITTEVVSSNPIHGDVYLIQHYVIKFFGDLRQVGGFLRMLRFSPPIKLKTLLKVELNTNTKSIFSSHLRIVSYKGLWKYLIRQLLVICRIVFHYKISMLH